MKNQILVCLFFIKTGFYVWIYVNIERKICELVHCMSAVYIKKKLYKNTNYEYLMFSTVQSLFSLNCLIHKIKRLSSNAESDFFFWLIVNNLWLYDLIVCMVAYFVTLLNSASL